MNNDSAERSSPIAARMACTCVIEERPFSMDEMAARVIVIDM